ncbi:outer membrane protein assembly factor [Acidisoma cellulosilytica]|uniref:Outer membrane protein assembly factor n=1 Tax=Acidisoma cellulosilyticum TaxID=2802395 RepID=A0A964E274_9PROT|nr:autotransporter assembly complex family protein [Acidisoma cellulosilyticum]MCB8879315.1 outer membrane protein assembly factor [Acidisoma cellulosilyticum]
MPPTVWLASAVIGLSLASPTRAADPQPYAVTFKPSGDKAMDKLVSQTSNLVALRTKAPAGPFALVLRARGDVTRLETVLNSAGYYDGAVTITIDGKSLDDPNLPQAINGYGGATPIPIVVTLTRGPLFHLGRVDVKGDVPPAAMKVFHLKTGDPAQAANVIAAGADLQSELQNEGYAFAKVATPAAYENPGKHTIDVTYKVTPGPRVDIGPINIAGLKNVHPGFVRRELTVKDGQLYNAGDIETARQNLAGLGVFSSVQAVPATAVGPDGRLPITFVMREGPPRTVSFTAGYATDTGGVLGASWTHHNLFGNGETLLLSAQATGLGGSSTTGLGYNIGATYTLPAFFRRDQQLSFNISAFKTNYTAYQETGETLGTTFTRQLDKNWSLSAGLSGTTEEVEQEGASNHYLLVQLPLTLKYDSTNSLFDPTKGVRATASITPSESLLSPSAFFTSMQLSASTYLDLSGKGRSVIALRGLVGTVQGASTFQLPPDQRFYAGGSNTIRGYEYQSVGPQFADGNPIGGTSIDAGTVEYRQRFGKSFGTALFVDAGQVGATSAPFQGGIKVGAGIGLRYYTPIGPIRVDFAVPVVHQDNSGNFQIYIGIGQAF